MATREGLHKLIQDVRALTQINSHTESLLSIAKFFGGEDSEWAFKVCFTPYIQVLELIKDRQHQRGYLDETDSQIRHGIYGEMMKTLKNVLDQHTYNDLKGAL